MLGYNRASTSPHKAMEMEDLVASFLEVARLMVPRLVGGEELCECYVLSMYCAMCQLLCEWL